ncbi:COG3650 family protein [Brevundimonas sp.]|uniref:COG3650 family protein n=1 Tax=Brevundimonas sp. TaxID=1871086 RepID=UPI0035AD8E6F
MRSLVVAALSCLAVAACSRSDDVEIKAAGVATPPPTLAGVDLSQPVRALGTEPFWSLELNGTDMIYTSPEPGELRAPQPAAVVQGTVAMFEAAATDGQPMKVTLTATECSDGMSDRTYPLTAIVELGERTLTGCAASTAAIMSAGESGPVDAPAQPAG